ncbi:MAG: hypothetical protein NT133_25765, partial [Alphaproteobacteria bacterium]|nr:hypothetical protein [Alphaproteobacteria bacterium]
MRFTPPLLLLLVAAALPLLGACTIVDQRSFAAPPTAPQPADVSRLRQLPALPLITVRFATAELDRAAIRTAVDLARARRPDARFEVVTPIDIAGSREAQAEALRQGRADAELVATALAEAGAARDHIEIGARADPGAP